MGKGVFDEKDKKKIFVVIFLILLGLAAYIIKSFLSALVVGALIAYFMYPWYAHLKTKFKSKWTAAGILSITSVIIITIILTLFVPPTVAQTQSLYQNSGKY